MNLAERNLPVKTEDLQRKRWKKKTREPEAEESEESEDKNSSVMKIQNFITSVHKMSEYCNYGCFRDEIIRDRIVVGIKDNRLSQKLQMDSDLTLAKAIEHVRQHELVVSQQHMIRPITETSVTAIRKKYDKKHNCKKCRYRHSKGKCSA